MQRLSYTRWIQFLGLISIGLFIRPVAAMPAQTVKPNEPTPITQEAPTQPTATQPVPTQPTQEATPAPQAAASQTIVDVASSNPSFKTLTAALQAAGLTQALEAQGPFTVFAPTDAAFAALPKGTVEQLLKPENKAQLVKLLTYHVVAGEVTADSLKSGAVKSLEGSPIDIRVNPKKGIMVNNAKVTMADVKASNGVIHAIDHVIIPPDLKVSLKSMASGSSMKPAMAGQSMNHQSMPHQSATTQPMSTMTTP